MTPTDDTHAQLLASLEASKAAAADGKAERILATLTTPLALASIALELREMRQLHQFIPSTNTHDSIDLGDQLAGTRSREARNANARPTDPTQPFTHAELVAAVQFTLRRVEKPPYDEQSVIIDALGEIKKARGAS